MAGCGGAKARPRQDVGFETELTSHTIRCGVTIRCAEILTPMSTAQEPDVQEAPASSARRRLPWRWLIVEGVAVCVIAAAVVVFFGVGRWLVVQDSLEPAYAVVVLSGRMPLRAIEAAKLYREGVTSRVWVTHPQGPAHELRQMGVLYVGEEFYSAKVLMAQGVPGDAIRVLERESGNTEEELTEVARLLREEGARNVIIVTSKAHTRRVRTIWSQMSRGPAAANLKMIVRYVEDDPYDGAHWWRHTQDALDVVREVLGLLNAWAGFPVRSAAKP